MLMGPKNNQVAKKDVKYFVGIPLIHAVVPICSVTLPSMIGIRNFLGDYKEKLVVSG